MADWKKKAKAEYLRGGISYRALAEKYGVSQNIIEKLGRTEGWVELRRKTASKTAEKTVEKIAEQQARRAERFQTLSDQLMDKLEEAIGQLDQVVVVNTTREKIVKGNTETTTETREVDTKSVMIDRKGLRDVAAALKDIREIQMIRSELDQQEQRARIAALEEKAKPEDKDNTIEVVFEDGMEEFAK